jgi:taurine-pyruvate aminotransferase
MEKGITDEETIPMSQKWREKDNQYMWHHMMPYTASQNPMIVSRGEGAYVVDEDGNRYLDAMSGLWCVNLGYSQQELAEAAFKQMTEMPFYPLSHSHKPAIELGEKLNEWLGGDYRIFYSNSGSEANETAFKIARQFHAQNGEPGRWKIISRYRAYHGNSAAALAATGQFIRKYKYEPLAPGFVHVPPPDTYRLPFGQTPESFAAYYEQVINWEVPETVAAVIMEPVITGGGVIVPPSGYIEEVRRICDKYGVLLIIDEVICGFGRSGKNFGFQHFDIEPDIVTMAKGITSGYLPLSATAVRAGIFDVFKNDASYTHFRHVNTFGGHPVSCAVAIRTLEIMEERNIVARAEYLGARLQKKLSVLKDHPNVGDLRFFGFLAGIELVTDKVSKTPAPSEFVAKVVSVCKRSGVIIGKNGDTVPNQNNVITLCPPFVVSDDEVDFIADTLIQTIQQTSISLK